MFRGWTWLILLAVLLVGLKMSLSKKSHRYARPLAERSLPDGFTGASIGSGSGRMFTARFSDYSSATAALKAALRSFASHFDDPPRVRAAVSDDRDSQAQAFFDARIGGETVAGVIVASLSGGAGSISLVYDYPQSLHASLAQLAGGPSDQRRPPAPRAVNWQTYNFPDGSGSINLPEGWTLEGAEQGEVHAHGAHGEYLSFGRPNYIQEYALPGSAGIPTMPFINDPVEALSAFERQMGMEIRILDSTSDQSPNLALALYDYNANGTPCRAFAYLRTMQTPGGGSWILYTSYVATPTDAFGGEFQTLLNIWKTYAISGQLINDRIQAAAKSMREAGEILRQSNANTSATYDRTNYAWSLCLREHDLIEDTWDNTRGEVATIDAHPLVDRLNREEGSARWRVVPMNEY